MVYKLPNLLLRVTYCRDNELQAPEEAEVTYASLFGQADDEFATLSNSTTEFATVLAQTGTSAGDTSGLYSIDITILLNETDSFWVNVFGLFPAGKINRYYFTFSEPHNFTGFSSDNSWLNLRICLNFLVLITNTLRTCR